MKFPFKIRRSHDRFVSIVKILVQWIMKDGFKTETGPSSKYCPVNIRKIALGGFCKNNN